MMKNSIIGLIGIIAGVGVFISVAVVFGAFAKEWHAWYLIVPIILGGC